MSKKVLVFDMKLPVYRTLEDAAKEFDVSPGLISMAANGCKDVCGVRVRWADRVFVLQMKDGSYVVAVKDQRGRKFLDLHGMTPVRKRDIERVKDITASWYFSKEEL